jgi:hypothetical protein
MVYIDRAVLECSLFCDQEPRKPCKLRALARRENAEHLRQFINS